MKTQAPPTAKYRWVNEIFRCNALTFEEQMLLYCALGGKAAFATLVLCDLGFCGPRGRAGVGKEWSQTEI